MNVTDVTDAPAQTLASHLLEVASREGMERVLPFWGDGGTTASAPPFAPGRHLLAAYPSSLVRAKVSDLGPGGLVPFLRRHLPPRGPERLPLVVVFLAYDAGRAAPGLERTWPGPTHDPHALDAVPDVLIATYPGYLVAPSEHGPWQAVGDTALLTRTLAASLAVTSTLDKDDKATRQALGAALTDPRPSTLHRAGVAHILDGIAAGDFYQVNLARRLEGRAPMQPAQAAPALFAALRRAQSTAFAALFPLGADAFLVSASPECLLAWDGERGIAQSYPIKGTIGRDPDPTRDAALAAALQASAKDQAEHVMIVDLVRHDLGRVARPGGVSVPHLMALMPLTTLHHLVSEVRAEVPDEVDLAEVLGALFPGGSITGAPKIAAMQALDRWEPFRRGPYYGSLGVVLGGAEAVFSILIRTAVIARDVLAYATGGGIVADSDPDLELAETELKAQALLRALS
ncbi:MAG: anthranilate synthase component I family protein [Deltaproteobacteria bacterium]|nr:anthranilate synthase component I family protein [Deltaproteobacteria bacterium]